MRHLIVPPYLLRHLSTIDDPAMAPAVDAARLSLSLDDTFRNIVEERFDAGVRLGESVEKDMIAVRIAPDMRMVVVGAPAYFAHHPSPQTPQDLQGHDCIGRRLPTHSGLLNWEFKRRGKSCSVNVSGRLAFNVNDLIVAAALGGHGLAWVRHDQVADHLAAGRLLSVLDDWSSAYSGYHLYYATRRSSPALALIVEALRYKEGS